MKKMISHIIVIAATLIANSSLAFSDLANKTGQIAILTDLNGPSVKSGEIEIENIKYDYESISGSLELLKEDPAEGNVELFYVAYFKKDKSKNTNRPITFIYNGGPGSASIWLHMGALGPKRVVTPKPKEKQLSPYTLIDNKYSLLDVSDLVFIDAPSTGYSTFVSNAGTYQDVARAGFYAWLHNSLSARDKDNQRLLAPWRVSTPPNCSLTGCTGWQKTMASGTGPG